MSSADAFPYTVNPIKPKHDQYLLRGKRAQFAHHDLADAAGLVEGLYLDPSRYSRKNRLKSRGDRLVA